MIRDHDRLLPTRPGYPPGLITNKPGWRTGEPGEVTVQCAVCWRTITGPTPFSVIGGDDGWNFLSDRDGGAPTPYRRCPDCRGQHLHPHPMLWEEP